MFGCYGFADSFYVKACAIVVGYNKRNFLSYLAYLLLDIISLIGLYNSNSRLLPLVQSQQSDFDDVILVVILAVSTYVAQTTANHKNVFWRKVRMNLSKNLSQTIGMTPHSGINL